MATRVYSHLPITRLVAVEDTPPGLGLSERVLGIIPEDSKHNEGLLNVQTHSWKIKLPQLEDQTAREPTMMVLKIRFKPAW